MDLSKMSDKQIRARRTEIELLQDQLRLEYLELGRELDARRRENRPVREPVEIQAEIDQLQAQLPTPEPVVIPVKLGVLQAIKQKLGGSNG